MTTREANQFLTLPLAGTHEVLGATFRPLAGWQVPAHYGDPEAEYNDARSAVGLLDVSFLTVVTGEGKDHIEYLNRRLSQRTLDLAVGAGVRANQLNAEGRMEADLEVFRIGEEQTLLLAPPAVAADYLQALMDKYVFSEDARFESAAGRWCAFALIGPRAPHVLEAFSLPVLTAGGRAIHSVEFDGFPCWLLQSDYILGAPVLLVPCEGADKAMAALAAQVQLHGGSRLGFLAFDTLRVEAGVPWWGIDLTDRSIPLEADLKSAIHFNKGCYPGQETIAKITNLGHPARKLVGILWEADDPPVADLVLNVDGKEAGRLTSSTYSPRYGKAIGLAIVRWQYREPGTAVVAENGLTGRVVGLPFA